MISRSSPFSRQTLLYLIAAFLLAGFFAARNLSTWPARISYPGEESYEGAALAEVALLGQGVRVYAPPNPAGFSGMTYGPLYYLVGAHLINPYAPTYFPLRILSAGAILGCAVGCGLLAFWLTRSWFAAALSPLVFLSYGVVTFHGVSALSDNVALFLFFSGFLLAYRFRDNRAIFVAIPLMALGFYYKPQFVGGPLAVLAYLMLEKRYARAAQFAGLMTGAGILMFGLFQWVVFRGQEFWRHFLLFQATLFSWHQWGIGLLVFGLMLGAPVLLAFEFLREQPDRMLGCYLVCAVLLGTITIGKATAFIHYFYETFLLVSILVPALLTKRLAKRSGALEVVMLLAIGLVAGQLYTPPAPQSKALAQYKALQLFLHTHFPVHTRALGFREGDLLQAGFDTPFSDFFQTELLARRGIVSDQCLVAAIHDRRFPLILLNFNVETEDSLAYYITPPALDTIRGGYRLATTFDVPFPEQLNQQDRFYVYVPRDAHPLVDWP